MRRAARFRCMPAKGRKKVVAQVTAEEVLGRPVEAAEQDPVSVVAPKPIAREWKRFYKRLLETRDGILDQQTRLQQETAQNQPQFMTDPGAETANAAFEQDKALGRVSTYQEMLDEVNGALRRIETGTYGVCELTGKPIDDARLEAIPWTRFSIEAEQALEADGKAPVHFEIPPQFSVREVSLGRSEAESTRHREQPGSRAGARARKGVMPAKSKKQQMAAGAALASKRGEAPKKSLRGASKGMAESMSEKQLEELASTKRKSLPKHAGGGSKSSGKKSGGAKSGGSKASGKKSAGSKKTSARKTGGKKSAAKKR
jgi:RNA polymerase-binding transcription factor DksA